MDFYQSIAYQYDDIFPLNKKQVSFVESSIKDLIDKTILDVGCGTGNLALALTKTANRVTGIDLDKEMLKIARTKNVNDLAVFIECDMLSLVREFSKPIDGIICFGNTLVHLESLDDIDLFLKQAKCIILKGGSLLIQIINYDRILDNNIDGLPTIENDNIKFERTYNYKNDLDLIDFRTVLTIKPQNKVIENSQMLYPIIKAELTNLLEKNQFKINGCYGSFEKEEFTPSSMHLIIDAVSV